MKYDMILCILLFTEFMMNLLPPSWR